MRILLIDNYDSFTFNIVEILRQFGPDELCVVKNDAVDGEYAMDFDKIVLSPGPATPRESGQLMNIVEQLASTHSILGICLGHQAIAEVFGATLQHLSAPLHGIQTECTPIGDGDSVLYGGIEEPMTVGLYHSWTVNPSNFPNELRITGMSAQQHILSIRHKKYDVRGVQFHPESYMTPSGANMIFNWLKH